MPLVTLTVRKPKSSAFKSTVLDAVHAALVTSGVPAADRFQRVIELDADDFRFDPGYPDLQRRRMPTSRWSRCCGRSAAASRSRRSCWPSSSTR